MFLFPAVHDGPYTGINCCESCCFPLVSFSATVIMKKKHTVGFILHDR